MRTNKATGMAWQVRQAEQQKILEEVKQKITQRVDDFRVLNLYRFFLHMLSKRLDLPQGKATKSNVPKSICWDKRNQVFDLFCEVSKEIEKFQCSEEEGNLLFAKLFVWAASEIVRPHHTRYDEKELGLLKKVYGVERATDLVPLK